MSTPTASPLSVSAYPLGTHSTAARASADGKGGAKARVAGISCTSSKVHTQATVPAAATAVDVSVQLTTAGAGGRGLTRKRWLMRQSCGGQHLVCG